MRDMPHSQLQTYTWRRIARVEERSLLAWLQVWSAADTLQTNCKATCIVELHQTQTEVNLDQN